MKHAKMKYMMVYWLFVSQSILAEDLFSKADAKAGLDLHEQHCIRCHAASFGADGSGIYTREYRIVKSQRGLLAQVRNCNTMIGLQWFDEDELNVAGYLNQHFYHFDAPKP